MKGSDRAFCSGGDAVALHHLLNEGEPIEASSVVGCSFLILISLLVNGDLPVNFYLLDNPVSALLKFGTVILCQNSPKVYLMFSAWELSDTSLYIHG